MDLLPRRLAFWDLEFFEGQQETELVGPLGVRAGPGRDGGCMCAPGSVTSAWQH